MRKLILKNRQSPGDIVVLTAAVRDLHVKYPGTFLTDVRTPCPAIWENNPYITPLDEAAEDVEVIDCQYPLIHKCNQKPRHFIEAFIDDLNQKLGLELAPSAFKGDIHISTKEKRWFSQTREILGEDIPFWIIVAGGKWDFTIKWWQHKRFQEVIDHFQRRILFVQVGEDGHFHPALRGVLDLRGKTNLRQLIRLVYHSQGVLCPVTSLMHFAAAIEVKGGRPKNRPCVVVAGGREPPHWEAYPHHQFIHTVGALFCCDNGGCWRSRTVALGDGDPKDHPNSLCLNVVDELPKCMDMITSHDVIRRIEMYFQSGVCHYLTNDQYKIVKEKVFERIGLCAAD